MGSSAGPVLELNARGEVADVMAVLAAIGIDDARRRYVVDDTVAHYRDGRAPVWKRPRRTSDTAQILDLLVAAGDARFRQRAAYMASLAARVAAAQRERAA